MDTAEQVHAIRQEAGRGPSTGRVNDRIRSLLIAVLVHVILALLLGLIVVEQVGVWEADLGYDLPAEMGLVEEAVERDGAVPNTVPKTGRRVVEIGLDEVLVVKHPDLFLSSWPSGLGGGSSSPLSTEPIAVESWRGGMEEGGFEAPKNKAKSPRTLGGLSVPTGNVGILVDCSWSMKDKLPTVRLFLEEHFPGQPALELDECGLSLDESGAPNRVLTAARVLVERYRVDVVYWISDLQDERTRKGIESLRYYLNPRGRRPIPLFVTSLECAPDGPLSRLVIETRGKMECIRKLPSSFSSP